MPAFEQAWQRYKESGLLILGVNQGESKNAIERFARQEVTTTFPLLLDQTTEVGAIYAVRALPTTVFIDADGRIQELKIGGPLDLASILDGILKSEGKR